MPPHLAESDFHVFRNVDLPIVVEVRTKGANADLLHIKNAIGKLFLLNLHNILRITLPKCYLKLKFGPRIRDRSL